MRPLAGAVAVLAALAVLSVVLLSIDTQQEPSELLLWRPVLNEPKTSQQLSVKNHDKKDVIAVPKGNTFLYQVATQHDEALARKYATHTASKMQVVCGGADFNAEACAEWYTPDVTVYDMAPPDGVIRGRENWRQRLQHDFQAVPTDLEMEIVHAGWVGYGSELIWTIGYMKKYVNGHKVGTFRFSSMMCNDHGIWRFYVFSVIHLYAHPNWTPVLHGRGQRLLAIARRDMAQFAKGYKTGNMKLAFKDYTPTARFPFMAQLGGTTVKFAEKEIMHEKKKLEKKQKTMIHPRVDEVLYPVSDATLDVAVAHGFSEMTDDRDAGMYSINRFTFLAVMVKRNNKWEVQYDFSPNAWLYGGSGE